MDASCFRSALFSSSSASSFCESYALAAFSQAHRTRTTNFDPSRLKLEAHGLSHSRRRVVGSRLVSLLGAEPGGENRGLASVPGGSLCSKSCCREDAARGEDLPEDQLVFEASRQRRTLHLTPLSARRHAAWPLRTAPKYAPGAYVPASVTVRERSSSLLP